MDKGTITTSVDTAEEAGRIREEFKNSEHCYLKLANGLKALNTLNKKNLF